MITTQNLEKPEKPGCRFAVILKGLDGLVPVYTDIDVISGYVHVLNALVPYHGLIAATRVSPECVARLGRNDRVRFINYISHQDTIKVLEGLTGRVLGGASRAAYVPKAGDIALVARLVGGSRLTTGPVSIDSLEYWIVVYDSVNP